MTVTSQRVSGAGADMVLENSGLGCASVVGRVEGLKDLFDLPEMAALMCRKHAKCSIHVVADASVDGRFDAYFVQRQTNGRLNDSRQTELRFFESIPGRLEIVALGNDRFQCFEAQPVGWFQVPDQHLRQSPSPKSAIVAVPRSTSDGRRN